MTASQLITALKTFKDTLPELKPAYQNTITRLAAWASPLVLPYEKKEIALGRHPMQDLYRLVERKIRGEQIDRLSQVLINVPKKLRDDIFYEVWWQATDWNKGGEDWGELHALDNLPRLLSAIKAVADKTLDHLSPAKKNALYGTIYQIAGAPETRDSQWGEHYAKTDTERLIRALHRHHDLMIPGHTISVCSDLETGAAQPSRPYHLNRRELDRGQIGFHNGIGCSFEDAKTHALTLSDRCAQQYNLHCTYSATMGYRKDIASALLGQGGTVTSAVIHLLEQWQDFFERKESDRLLQICHSRGAVEVNTALGQLPPALRQRIIVVSIAPAYIIPQEMAYNVINLVIPSDPVVQVAANRQLLDSPHTHRLSNHTDTDNPHDMHGSSFQGKLIPLIANFIRTNDIA